MFQRFRRSLRGFWHLGLGRYRLPLRAPLLGLSIMLLGQGLPAVLWFFWLYWSGSNFNSDNLFFFSTVFLGLLLSVAALLLRLLLVAGLEQMWVDRIAGRDPSILRAVVEGRQGLHPGAFLRGGPRGWIWAATQELLFAGWTLVFVAWAGVVTLFMPTPGNHPEAVVLVSCLFGLVAPSMPYPLWIALRLSVRMPEDGTQLEAPDGGRMAEILRALIGIVGAMLLTMCWGILWGMASVWTGRGVEKILEIVAITGISERWR